MVADVVRSFCQLSPGYCKSLQYKNHILKPHLESLLDLVRDGAYELFQKAKPLTTLDSYQQGQKAFNVFRDFVANQCDHRWPFTTNNIDQIKERHFDDETYSEKYSDCKEFKVLKQFISQQGYSSWTASQKTKKAKVLSHSLANFLLQSEDPHTSFRALDTLLFQKAFIEDDPIAVKDIQISRQEYYKDPKKDLLLSAMTKNLVLWGNYGMAKTFLEFHPILDNLTESEKLHPLLVSMLKNYSQTEKIAEEQGDVKFDMDLFEKLLSNGIDLNQKEHFQSLKGLFNFIKALRDDEILYEVKVGRSVFNVAVDLNNVAAQIALINHGVDPTSSKRFLEKYRALKQSEDSNKLKLYHLVRNNFESIERDLASLDKDNFYRDTAVSVFNKSIVILGKILKETINIANEAYEKVSNFVNDLLNDYYREAR